jgi:hypothetical protein
MKLNKKFAPANPRPFQIGYTEGWNDAIDEFNNLLPQEAPVVTPSPPPRSSTGSDLSDKREWLSEFTFIVISKTKALIDLNENFDHIDYIEEIDTDQCDLDNEHSAYQILDKLIPEFMFYENGILEFCESLSPLGSIREALEYYGASEIKKPTEEEYLEEEEEEE